MEVKTPISINVYACLCDKVTTAGHSKLSPYQEVIPLINVPSAPRQERKWQTPKGRERKNKWHRRIGGRLSQQILKVNIVREGFCLQRVFYFCVWFFTSECRPAYSAWRSGGHREVAVSSHPRTSLLSVPPPALWPEGKHTALMLTCWLNITLMFAGFTLY